MWSKVCTIDNKLDSTCVKMSSIILQEVRVKHSDVSSKREEEEEDLWLKPR